MILGVSGSRALAQAGRPPAAEAWARDEIRRAFDAHAPTHVFTGAALGPDRWAADEARARQVTLVVYDLDGCVYVDGTLARDGQGKPARWAREAAPGDGEIAAVWAAWCLHRDRMLVRQIARRAGELGGAHVLALLAPAGWSRTNGTRYTVERARRLGLGVTERAYRVPA